MTDNNKIRKTQITQWMKDPVTERLLMLLKVHKEASEEAIKDLVVNSSATQIKDHLELLIQLKAQVNTLDTILEIKEFILTEEEKDELNNSGASNIIEGSEI